MSSKALTFPLFNPAPSQEYDPEAQLIGKQRSALVPAGPAEYNAHT